MKVLLDTCAIIWAIVSPERLSNEARDLLNHGDTEVFLSPLSSAEIACACERGRLELDRHWRLWTRHFYAENGWQMLPIDLEIVEEAYSLPPPFHNDPVDRIIVATARIERCPVVTGDQLILQYPHVQTLQ